MTGTLQGITVLDLSRLLPGPMASMILGDYGARVITIDTMVGGGGAVTSTRLASLERHKEILRINARSEKGHELLLDLVRRADVVIESFKPGSDRAMGLDYESLRAVNPALVYCSITGYGQTGPLSRMAGHDINFQGIAGIVDLSTPKGCDPVAPGVQTGDVMGGAMQAVIGVLLALYRRKQTGEGQFVDIAMADGLLPLLMLSVDMQRLGMPVRCGESILGGALACYGFYRTADNRHLAVGALEAKFFARLCAALGVPELAGVQYDMSVQDESRARLKEIFLKRTADEWEAMLGPLDVCVSKVATFEEVFENSQFRARGMVDGGEIGVPVKQGAIDTREERPVAKDAVLRELGLSEVQIDELRAQGAVG
ncbi:MAG: CaiB/BaiF CoA-transferase family protein [Myxococcota bacterium]|jgi:crotonobetainyl-CoA:carnitine CoA-transferase CaiB-like acyl-CoA transferase